MHHVVYCCQETRPWCQHGAVVSMEQVQLGMHSKAFFMVVSVASPVCMRESDRMPPLLHRYIGSAGMSGGTCSDCGCTGTCALRSAEEGMTRTRRCINHMQDAARAPQVAQEQPAQAAPRVRALYEPRQIRQHGGVPLRCLHLPVLQSLLLPWNVLLLL